MVAQGVEDLLLGYRSVMVRARETAPAMAVIGRMKFPALAAEKNSTRLVAYVK